jgi:hypothetical protein
LELVSQANKAAKGVSESKTAKPEKKDVIPETTATQQNASG